MSGSRPQLTPIQDGPLRVQGLRRLKTKDEPIEGGPNSHSADSSRCAKRFLLPWHSCAPSRTMPASPSVFP